MAIVYLAHDLKHDRRVALKVLRPEVAAALGAERFLREITTTANLRHPHILPLYDSGRTGGQADGRTDDTPTVGPADRLTTEFLYYVMPYVEGESLRDRLEREKQLPVDDAVEIARQVASALSYAHSRGVVHRDIKPENILLESGHAVVADFGIARALNAAGGERLTQTGLAVGTPAYMSPEQVAGEPQLDGRSDLYALGCVVYEMLAGQPPFTGPTVESLVHQHLTVEAPSIGNLRPTVPPTVAAAVQRALAKNPADRFNPIAQFADAIVARAATGPAPVQAAASRPPWRRLGIGGAGVALAALALVLITGRGRQASQGGTALTSLAVLPLENLSAEPGQEYFVDGMTDALITELSKIEALRVISRTSVMPYRGTETPLRDIARELHVDGVVEGSVLRAGARVRVNAQLIDAVHDRNLWAESYERGLDDVLALHSEVARAIAQQIRIVLTADDEQRLTAAHPVDREAHDLLLRGRYYWEGGDKDRGLALMEAATVQDPAYAVAWAELAEAYASSTRDDPASLPRARAALQRALDLDPDLAEVQTALGRMAFYHDWDWETARRALERAIALNPGYDDAHQIYGDYFEILGRWDEAIAEGVRSKEVNPVSAVMRLNLGLTYTYAGRFDAAIAECQSAQELDARSSWAYFCLADAYLRKGEGRQALAAAQTAVRLDSADVHRAMLARVYALSGDRDRADSVVTSLEAAAKTRYVSPWFLSWVHIGLGHTDRALALLERAVAEHATYTPWVNSLPDFDAVRSDPRFQALLRRMNLPDARAGRVEMDRPNAEESR